MRTACRILAVITILLTLPLHAADCPTPNDFGGTVALSGNASKVTLKNPAKGGSAAKICLLTEGDLENNHTCSTADALTAAPTVVVGLCTAGKDNFNSNLTSDAIAAADAILVEFRPAEAGQTVKFLRVEAKDAAGKDLNPSPVTKVVATAGTPDFSTDSRYKVWLYTGYTYLRTKNDFKDGYPELLARFETRLFDDAIYLEQTDPAKFDRMRKHLCLKTDHCGFFPHFNVFRLYGETGLTGTTVASTSTSMTNPPVTTTTVTGVKQAFSGNVGLGYGWTLPVTTRPTLPGEAGDTNAFTILAVSRLGIVTVPGVDADTTKNIVAKPGTTAFNWSTGIRIENANLLRGKGGNFEGAYFEFGFGENEQFALKKVPRLRVDGLVPLPAGSDLVRFALRLQLDTTRPFNRKENSESNGEIRISGLFNIDLKELARRFGGGK
ncbi:MAG: hypothetical protein JO093_19165 [Acidobacteria bacterium]|nr:hypothetical protein [Acidobacteriota bacterium]MBV9187745.1 hypothetical protein [Acidobacteriota bacterium]